MRDLAKKQAYMKEYYLKNRDKAIIARKKHYEANRELCIERSRIWTLNNKRRRKHNTLMASHGISIEVYEEMLHNQDNKCFCCGISHLDIPNGLYVDHCHKTGKVRGLLCSTCNLGIGYAKDNVEILKNMIKYLEKEKC